MNQSGDLIRLVYYSRNRIPADGEALEAAVTQILATSQVNNAKAAISGALMFNSGCFAQVLEGPVGAVETTFERIQRDDRHGDVSLLGLDRIDGRNFGNWSMAFVGTSVQDSERFAVIGSSSGFDPAAMTGERLHEVLLNLTIEEERAVA